MSRAELLAKLQRDLASLKSRVGRICNEAFSAKREVVELEGQLQELGKGGDERA